MIGHICFARNPLDWGHGRGHPADVETLLGSGGLFGFRVYGEPQISNSNTAGATC